jgi:hypothetical protein
MPLNHAENIIQKKNRRNFIRQEAVSSNKLSIPNYKTLLNSYV